MSGLNPLISLQAGNAPTFGPDMRQVASLAELAMRMQQFREQNQTLGALRNAYANPQNFVGGAPTMAAISQAGQISPQAAMQLTQVGNEAMRAQAEATRMEYLRQSLSSKTNQSLMKVKEDALETYQTARARGLPEAEARAAAQRVYTDGNQQVFDTGLVPPSQMKAMPPNFDPMAVPQHIDQWKKLQDYVDAQKKEGREEQKFGREGVDKPQTVVGDNTGGQPVFAQLNKDTGRI